MSLQNAVMCVGEISLDDVVVEDQHVDWKQAGGGALYSAIGASLWAESAICSTVGADYPQVLLNKINSFGIDISAINQTTECGSLGLWLLYESSGDRHQFEKASGGKFDQLDALRPSLVNFSNSVAGFHLAPQSSSGHRSALEQVKDLPGMITLDILVESYIDTSVYLQPEFLNRVDAFLPSNYEVLALWGHDDAPKLRKQLHLLGFKGVLVIKRGPDGVDVVSSNGVVNVPAVNVNVLDVTGAGDAFCGGFLAGLISSGDPITAAAQGVVSASFIVETRGAVAALNSLNKEKAQNRFDNVIKSIRRNS